MYKKGKGFTLAEILVALSLIGVISVLTIPSLITNTNVKKKTMAYQKSQSVLTGAFAEASTDACANLNMLLSDFIKNMGVRLYYTDANPPRLSSTHGITGANAKKDARSNWIVTNDGIAYRFEQLLNGNCTNDYTVIKANTAASIAETRNNACFEVIIDIDGPKKGENTPAVIALDDDGKIEAITGDRFTTWIASDGIATGNPTLQDENAIAGAILLDTED